MKRELLCWGHSYKSTLKFKLDQPCFAQVLTPDMVLDISGDAVRATAFAIHSKMRPARVRSQSAAGPRSSEHPFPLSACHYKPAIILPRPGQLPARWEA